MSSEKGIILGHGLRILKQASRTDQTASTVVENNAEHKGSTSRYLGPVSTKPSTYLSNFIIYIATIGDIVDGTDTTHDFNYFSLVYERPKDVSHLQFYISCSEVRSNLYIFTFNVFPSLYWKLEMIVLTKSFPI